MAFAAHNESGGGHGAWNDAKHAISRWCRAFAMDNNFPFRAMLEGRARFTWREIGWVRIAASVAIYGAYLLWTMR